MATLRLLLADGESRLRSAAVESPRTDAEWLLAELCSLRRSELALHWEEDLPPEREERWERLLSLRCGRVPLQRILGTAHFCGIPLAVDGPVLIPRPETEQLIELVAREMQNRPPRTILDLGTGSGACILALGRAFPSAELTASDISSEALALARRNGERCAAGTRIRFVRSDWFSELPGRWDLIVANPPYLTEEEWQSAEPEVRLHEPQLALLGGGPDGAGALRTILRDSRERLTRGGLLALEMGTAQGPALSVLGTELGFAGEIFSDFSGRERFFLARLG
ncbi:MAG: peptide chain release factor N(5)-glutamine methyltransferase [Puniceicoccales bacterium]|jgi:release factor glutamine methyltransferase|nr:peptide chain release factor N(5)-glutamine methyltransferase [Puniceicoccales bacterium]